jgi:RNA polymerase sigma-32 factor
VVSLSREEERAFARAWIAGDRAAGERLVEACLPFVISIALEYRRWGVPLEDIVQQGNLGLLRAASKFELARDCRLATYAAYWIRAEIREYVVRFHRVVRLGTTKGERKALRAYRRTQETDPQVLSELSGLSVPRIEQLMPLLTSRETSLDFSDENHPSPLDKLAAFGPSPEEATELAEQHQQSHASVAKALDGLSARERLIVEERMMNEDPATLQELGAKLGVSKERVRQLEGRVKDKLRSSLRYMLAS